MERVKQVGRVVLTVVLVAGLGAGGWFGFHSEAFQRVLGKREATKVGLEQPRPAYQSLVIQERQTMVLDGHSTTIVVQDDVTIDLASGRAKVKRSGWDTGLDAAQTSISQATQPRLVQEEIFTRDEFLSFDIRDGGPWKRYRINSIEGPYLGTDVVPVLEDVIGFELATLPYASPDTAAAPSSVDGPSVPQVPASAPADVKDLRRWSLDLGSFESLAPVAFAKLDLDGQRRSTSADVTIGFDELGVMRYLQVTVDPTAALPSEDGSRTLTYEWILVELRDTPETIEMPTDVEDATDQSDPVA